MPSPLCSLSWGLCLIFPLQKLSCACLAGPEGPPYRHLQSPPLGWAHNTLVRQPGGRAVAHKWAQALPSALRTQGLSRTEVSPSLPEDCHSRLDPSCSCLNRFPPHWKDEKKWRGNKCPHALGLRRVRIKYRNSPKLVSQVCASSCVTQENDYLSRAYVLDTHQPFHPWNSPVWARRGRFLTYHYYQYFYLYWAPQVC